VNVITENEDTVEQDEDDSFVVVESQVSVLTQEQVRRLNHHLSLCGREVIGLREASCG
jgi:hypothetical protein